MTKYKNGEGRRWSFLRWHHIGELLDPGTTYLSRLRIIETPWFGVFLHAIRRPDLARDLHNHPWGFGTLVLRGGYDESWAPDGRYAIRAARGKVPTELRHWRPLSFHRIRHGEFHTISRLGRTPTWTLLFVGPRRTAWGFATAQGYVDQDTYIRRARAMADHPAGGW